MECFRFLRSTGMFTFRLRFSAHIMGRGGASVARACYTCRVEGNDHGGERRLGRQRTGVRPYDSPFHGNRKQFVAAIFRVSCNVHTHKTLHATALLFRILRQHAFYVSQGANVFEGFTDDEKNFKLEIGNDVQGMLSKDIFSNMPTNLKNIISKDETENKVKESTRNVLEGLPYHHSPYRVEA
ncbi:hypothetical protein Ahy_A09g043327 [Arachis hypogaea]|uniref:Terpene synthase N-terminal domain-containing protein n=1 Tax=Arachis hypogaea TaxID=3818 RepID=A0A445BHZ9_ARAHY|nr:hypothetical protein Ahy_A09g043327 [Arachis hypogaea]